MYLSEESVDYTFKLMNEFSSPGSLVVFDYIYSSVLRQEQKYYGESAIYNRVKKDKEAWAFGIEDGEIEKFLSIYNLALQEYLDSETLERKYFTDKMGNKVIKVNGTHCIVLARKK
jgi:O-methyltransferase involved in polyketide biosynthesis